MEHLFYKELWDVRNQITAKANESAGESAIHRPIGTFTIVCVVFLKAFAPDEEGKGKTT
jgi:hypothetical protein